MADLADLTGEELLRSYEAREASPTDAVEACIGRIEAVDPTVNAVLTLTAERCREQAKVAERRWAEGRPRRLEGLPFGVKDIIAVEGVRTTGGSKIYADFIPKESATAVARLEAEGALLLAKLQTAEFAFGDNAHYGTTRNPWNLERTAGASSFGSGAALAARELPLALGSDTGGSIRIPAGYCGVVGFKPTYGLVPRCGVMTQSWTLDHVGPMARSVRDVALMLAAMAGYDERDPTSLRRQPDDYAVEADDTCAGLRVGIPRDWCFDLCEPAVEQATRAAADTLVDHGASLVEVDLPHAAHAHAIGWTIMYAEFASLHEVTYDRIGDYGDGMTRRLLVNSQFVSAQDYLRALRARHLIQRDFEAVFDEVDVLIAPGPITTAPLLTQDRFTIGERSREWLEVIARPTLIFNLAGVPALSLPAGFDGQGLPVGIQIAAPPLGDATCLAVGAAFQRFTSHHLASPVDSLLASVAS